ncbi:DNA gyrase subunit A [bacterium]|nr:MAG: DNA gyrase subunit A [bacterium]
MADNIPEETNLEEQPTEIVKPGIGTVKMQAIEFEMEKSYLEYAMSVIVSRALPDVRDGLKPVHRRILYAMHTIGVRANTKYRKSATVVGEVIGKYHPHGDSAIYESMVRMAQDFSLRYPMVDGQGNFGSVDGDSAAAMRYTEARMTKIAEEMLADIDKDTVDFMPNYDGSQREPKVLPAKIPNLLLNGVQGIAVGMATNIPTHNLREMVDAIVAIIDNPDVTIDELMKIVKGPDFPTGATIFDDGGITSAYGTGRGSITMRAVAEIVEYKKGRQAIIVTEIPYQVVKSNLIEKIAELHQSKKVVGISDLRDESSDRGGMRIVIELKKDAYPQKILNQLYKHTPLQTAFHVNMLALVDGIQPRVLNLEMVLRYYLDHRRVVVRRRTEFDLRKAEARAHILEGLLKALDEIDAVISTIRESETQDEARQNLIKRFDLTEIQANAILAMQLRTLAGLERKKIQDEYNELQNTIAKLKEILSSDANILKVIREELLEVREKYGDDRRTQIERRAVGNFSEEDLVPNEDVIITVTHGGYIKRMPADTYKSQGRGGKGIMGMATKEEDVVEHVIKTKNHDWLLFFTSQGRAFRVKVYEIPAASRTAKGVSIVNILNLAPEEKVTSTVSLTKEEKEQYLFMATRQGTIKKTKITDFANIRSTGIIAIKLDREDELIWVKKCSDGDDIILSTAKAQALRFGQEAARPMGRATRGVRGVRLRADDRVVGVDVVGKEEGLMLVTCANGYGKLTKTNQFTKHARGGVGIKAGVVTAKTGEVIDARVIVSRDDELLLISKQGQVIRLRLKDISVIGRATQGVRIMKLKDGDSVASLALMDASGDPELTE